MSDKSIIEQIKHYQKDIVRCPSDTKRMIRCIERLMVLPVTISHLQETGVGRSVNELRKSGGEVGAAANSLVCKWKSMVKADESEESDTQASDEKQSSSTNHNTSHRKIESSPNAKPTEHSSDRHKKTVPSEHSHTVHSSNHHKKSASSEKSNSAHSSAHNTKSVPSENSSNKTNSRHEVKASKDVSNHKHSSSRSDRKPHERSSSKPETIDQRKTSSHKSKPDTTPQNRKDNKINSEDECNGRKDSVKKPDTHRSSKSDHSSHRSHPTSSEHRSKSSKYNNDKYRKKESLHSHRSLKKYDSKKDDSDSSDDDTYKPSNKKQRLLTSDEEETCDTTVLSKKSYGKRSSSKRESSDEGTATSESEEEKFHVKTPNDSDNNDGNESVDNDSDSDQEASDKGGGASDEESEDNSESASDEEHSQMNQDSQSEEEEYVPVKIKREKESPVRQIEPHRQEKQHSHHSKRSFSVDNNVVRNIKQEKVENHKIKKEKLEKTNENVQSKKEEQRRSDKKHNDNKSRSHSTTSSQDSKLGKKVKVKIEKEEDGSIDCVSGASFADALLGLSDPKKKTVKKKINSTEQKTHKLPEKNVTNTKRSSHSERKSLPSTSSKNSFNEPDLLSKNIKLEPLDVDLKATLPEITPNYKPLPHYSPPSSPLSKRAKLLTDEADALSTIISTRNQRTKVYSGNRSGYTKVPSLFELCIQILQNNIEGLEYTGGVPYDLLKPVLERATAEQLHQLEYFNPYLVEDTDGLWQFHCKKEFRGREPDEYETWREMYLRLLGERETKLKTLKENISQSMAKSTPVRQTKMAYIDSVVKPPRNVVRQQNKMGTGKPTKRDLLSKAAVGAASGSPAPETVKVPAPSKSSNSQFPIPNFLKKKKAPLMAKALQLIKGNRYKR